MLCKWWTDKWLINLFTIEFLDGATRVEIRTLYYDLNTMSCRFAKGQRIRRRIMGNRSVILFTEITLFCYHSIVNVFQWKDIIQ